MSFLSFKKSPSKKQQQDEALAEAQRQLEVQREKQKAEEEERKRKKQEVLATYKQERPKEVNPPRSRLNPKLIQRGAVPGYEDLPPEKKAPKVTPKLAHNGQSPHIVFLSIQGTNFKLINMFMNISIQTQENGFRRSITWGVTWQERAYGIVVDLLKSLVCTAPVQPPGLQSQSKKH